MKASNMESFADEIDLQVKDGGQGMMRCSAICTLPETNIAPKNGWLD